MIDAAKYFTLIYYHDVNNTRVTYNDAFRKSRLNTSQSEIPLTIGTNEFFEGYRFAVEYLWQRALESQITDKLLNLLKNAQNREQ